MFFRAVKVRSSSGQVHEYIRLVESVRDRGRPKQKVIANLGRRDVLEPLLPRLVRYLRGEEAVQRLVPEEGPLEAIESSTWGPVLVTRTLFAELDLWRILEDSDSVRAVSAAERRLFADRVMALVANRLTCPTSEHGLARWLETDFVCDRQGRRFVPVFKTHNRVRVDFGQLQGWYRTLDRLVAEKDRIEVRLYERLRDLFSLEPDLVFYDLTSTYFEGAGPPGFARHGYSRDGKPRNPQVLVGVVMVNGWPIAHHVFEGNRRDNATVQEVLKDLLKRFKFKRVVFVGDRGMVTHENVDFIKDQKQGYLLGLVRRRRPEVLKYIERATGRWQDCPLGINAREKGPGAPRTRVQEVQTDQEGLRVFVVESDERREYEARMRERSMERTRVALEKLRQRVGAGRLKRPEKVGAAAAWALSRHHGDRYFTWELQDGRFLYREDPALLEKEKRLEGTYLIQTEEKGITPIEAVVDYKELTEVERGFRSLKDPLSMRPIWHQKEERVRAHIFVAALAFLLDRFVERRLREARVDLSSREALQTVKTVRTLRVRVNGQTRVGVTPGSPRAQRVLRALGTEDRHPPTPPRGRQAVV